MTITFRTDFDPATKAALIAEGANLLVGFDQQLPLGLWPAPGDLWADDRVSDRTFLVANRIFHWDEEGNLIYQVLLEISPADTKPFGVLGNVRPLVR